MQAMLSGAGRAGKLACTYSRMCALFTFASQTVGCPTELPSARTPEPQLVDKPGHNGWRNDAAHANESNCMALGWGSEKEVRLEQQRAGDAYRRALLERGSAQLPALSAMQGPCSWHAWQCHHATPSTTDALISSHL